MLQKNNQLIFTTIYYGLLGWQLCMGACPHYHFEGRSMRIDALIVSTLYRAVHKVIGKCIFVFNVIFLSIDQYIELLQITYQKDQQLSLDTIDTSL